jgi:hypothetical protein
MKWKGDKKRRITKERRMMYEKKRTKRGRK